MPLKYLFRRIWMHIRDHMILYGVTTAIVLLITLSVIGLMSMESFYLKMTLAQMPITLLMGAFHAAIFVFMYMTVFRGGFSKLSKGKIKAAEYLSNKGINVICFTDRFLPDILLQDKNILGSPPIRIQQNRIILGDQPITIKKQDNIVAMDTPIEPKIYAIQYYDTPARYFRNLEIYRIRTSNFVGKVAQGGFFPYIRYLKRFEPPISG